MAPGSSSSDTGLQSGVCWTSPVCGADRSPSPGRRCGGAGGDSGAGRGHWPSLAPPVPAHCLLGPFPPRPTRHQIKTRFTHSLKAPELPSGEFLRGCCTLGPHPAGLPTSGLPQAAGRSAGPETVLGTGPVGPASALLWLTASQVSKEKTPQGVSPVPVAAVGRPHGEMRGFRGEQGTAGGSRSLARLHAGRAVEALGARCVRVQAPLCLGVCLVNRCLEKTLQVRTLRCPRLTQLLMKRIKLAVFPFSGYSSEPCRTCTDSWNHPAWLVLCKMVMCASGLCTPLVPGKMQVMRRSDGPRMLPTKKQPSDVGGGPCVPKNR